ncbi:Gfo/Idh/MocA family oxidoreductase [Paenibacillus sp. N1-5-1-14]|uniref:Gfo/Idh/MocA family protein n=1 Tax=Paenibacillus radicibacter TaxID=2972488 RepID=UPI0021599190|nr:Gfo/Idh/MocA family oxidoreductase [Paenibacillus radicibacter]MCR8643057.1 Gfo/Idh/MocA family oxidoreductase [Paenibacillus radicibacter]
MKTIRIGLIGVGLIGKMHLDEYADIPGAEVVAVCDINEAEVNAVAAKYNIPHVYTDFRKMLERDDLDCVDVCLHNNFHAPVTIAALEAGKQVYCEKPIAGSYYDGKAMVDAAKRTGNQLHIQIATLYHKETKLAKELIEDGKLGKLYHARSNGYRRRGRPYVDGYGTPSFTRKETAGGGALFDMGVYHISQILYLLGIPNVRTITGQTYQEMDMDQERRTISGFNVEELGLGFVKFDGGATLDIMEAWSVHLGGFEGSCVIGADGGIRLPAYKSGQAQSPMTFHSTLSDMDLDSIIDVNASNTRRERMSSDYDAYRSSQHHLIAALQGRVPMLPTAEIALQTMLISEGIYMSSELGREVTAEEVVAQSKSTAIII